MALIYAEFPSNVPCCSPKMTTINITRGNGLTLAYFYCYTSVGFPALIVVISLAATQAHGYGTSETCWLDVPSGLIWAFIAPAVIIILVS